MKHAFLTILQGLVILIMLRGITFSLIEAEYIDRAFILFITTHVLAMIFIIGIWFIANRVVRERRLNDKNKDDNYKT
jgi:cbb3-type cytochrome oxidase subunit 3